MKSISMHKRIGAVLLALSLLCGMVFTGALPAAADTEPAEVTKFEADFDGLAAITEQQTIDYLESKFAFYYSQETNAFERFDVNGYAVDAEGVEHTTKGTAGTFFAPDTKASLGNYVDGIGSAGNSGNPIAKWTLEGDKWLCYLNNNRVHDHLWRKSGSLAVKGADGQLVQIDNFKLDMDFVLTGADGTFDTNALAVAFRSDNPYVDRGVTTQGMFAISAHGGYFFGDNYITALDAGQYIFNSNGTGDSDVENVRYDNFTTENASALGGADFMNNQRRTNTNTAAAVATVWPKVMANGIGKDVEVHMTLTVVNNTATVKLTDAENGVLLEETVTLSRTGAGYLVISGSGNQGKYANIEVTRLDVNGNPVDFNDETEGFDFGESFDAVAKYYEGSYYRNTDKDMFWLEGKQTTYYTFDDTTYADDVDTIAHLKEQFDLYTYYGGGLFKLPEPYMDSEDSTDTDDVWTGNGAAANFARWYYTVDGFTARTGNDMTNGGEALRKGVTLSPKMDGKPICARNVELYTDLVFTANNNNYSIWNISLRSAQEGRIVNGNTDSNNTFANHIALQVRPDGINIADGVKVRETTAAITDSAGYTAYADGEKHYNVRVYAKVDGRKLTVKVTDNVTGATLFEVTDKAVSYLNEGYVNISSGQAKTSIANLYVNVLEDKMTPSFNADYAGMFAYNSLNTADVRIPAYLRQEKNLNAKDFFGTSAAGYNCDAFDKAIIDKLNFAVADGYSFETTGEGEEAVTTLLLNGGAVLSTAEEWVTAIDYADDTREVIKVTRNGEYLNQIVDDLSKEFYDYLDSKFSFYYTDVKTDKGSAANNGWGSEASSVYLNRWLQFSGLAAASNVSSYMKEEGHTPIDQHISTMVPKVDGYPVKGKDFYLSLSVRLSDTKNYGTAYIIFNMPEKGQIGAAAATNGVIAFNSDLHAIKINKSELKFWNGTEWVDLVAEYTGANDVADITIESQNGVLTGSVTFNNKPVQTFEVQLTNTDAGYFAIGHNGGSMNFGALNLQVYDDFVPHTCVFDNAKSDAENHWNECDCGEKDEVIPHDYTIPCYDADGHWNECECGAIDEVQPHAYDAVEYDETEHWNECDCGAKDQVAEHEFDNDCDVDCACGYIREVEPHVYDNVEYDENGHWNECDCGEKDEVLPHEFDNDDDATCDCGYTRTVVKKGWKLESGKWYYYTNGVKEVNKWMKDSKGWVYLGADGAMVTNKWVTDSKGWCYVGADGYAVTNCWKKDSKGWIWLDANGSMTKSKWIKDNNKWYYLDAEGYMITNKWQKDSKGWVYVGADGAMVTNKWVTDSKGWCYVGADGYAVTNTWKKDSKGWIYLDANGSMTKSKWVKDDGKWYYCDASGYMVAGKSMTISGKKYNFNASGVCTNP